MKLLHVILSTVLILTKHMYIVNKNSDYKMLVMLDQNTMEYQIYCFEFVISHIPEIKY